VEHCDVLVVGGGPAGSSCAWGLRDAALDVLVLDRHEFPRDKVCAGWVTPQVMESLEVDLDDYGAKRVLQPIRGFRTRRIGDRPGTAAGREIVSWGIRRCEFDEYLLRRSGARLRLGEPLHDLERRGEGWLVNGAITARRLIGAGGHFCPVARRLTSQGSENVIAAQELELELSPEMLGRCPVDPELPEIFFTPDLRGYGWLFLKGNVLNVGLGRLDKAQLASHLEEFVAFLRSEGRLPEPLPGSFRGHAYLLHDQTGRPLAHEGVLLVGDATGLAYPRSGEGIRPAVESGLLAARALRAAPDLGAPEVESAYVESVEARFGRSGTSRGPGLTGWLPRAWTERLAGWLFATPWLSRRIVVDGWFTHRHEPALRDASAGRPSW
jgi:flavin-dependent dehydrogenase